MSYTSELKSNMMSHPLLEEEAVRAELSALLSSEADFYIAEDEITCRIRTDNVELARYIEYQIENNFGIEGRLQVEESKRFGAHLSYEVIFENANEFLDAMETVKRSSFGFYNPILNTIFEQSENVRAAFLRGIFLGCGNITDPTHGYHLEIDGSNDAVAETCAEILADFSISPHVMKRKHSSVLYLKDAYSIADFLRLIGAEESARAFEDAVEVRQVRGNINRQVNCETANMKKIARAAGAEIEAVEYLIESGNFSKLESKLQSAALIRLDQPDLSIGELAKVSKPKVSRSTLYRRLKQIVKIAEEYRNYDTE